MLRNCIPSVSCLKHVIASHDINLLNIIIHYVTLSLTPNGQILLIIKVYNNYSENKT